MAYELLHHYRVLKQFLDISNDTGIPRKNASSRAAKARDKLLKLSIAQFRELSTDVYDELRRRIDESRTEPDFLLPNLNFHPKRNQARQKLSSLPQSRFRDLVSDISYEIERRQLHESSTSIPVHYRSLHTSNGSYGPAFPDSATSNAYSGACVPQTMKPVVSGLGAGIDLPQLTDSAITSSSLYGELGTPDTTEAQKHATLADISKLPMAVQPANVVPAKASMVWSSDDEAAVKNLPGKEPARRISLSNTLKNKPPEKIAPELPELDAKRASMLVLRERCNLLELNNLDLRHRVELANTTIASLKAEKKSLEAECKLSQSSSRPELVRKELDALRSANAALRLENNHIKSTMRRDSKAMARDTSTANNSLASPIGGPIDVNAELRRFYEKLDTIAIKPSSTENVLKEELLRNEVLQWQKKYEQALAKMRELSFKMPSTDLQSHTSPTGSIPLSRATHFFSLIETFIESLGNPDADIDLLFEKISSIALAANKISGLKDNDPRSLQASSHSDSIREAASHALTATRYYATYPKLMPRVIVERAVSEIAFTMCEHISVAKLSVDDSKPIFENSISSLSDSTQPDGVRPLKMASRTVHDDQKVTEVPQVPQPIQKSEKREILTASAKSAKPTDPKSATTTAAAAAVPAATTVAAAAASAPLVKANSYSQQNDTQNIQSSNTKDTAPDCETVNDSPISPLTAKPSILEKVKHFEKNDSQVKRASFSPTFHMSHFSDDILASLLLTSPKNVVRSLSESIDGAPAKATEDAPKSKSVFQSLRERFTTDSPKNTDPKAKEAEDTRKLEPISEAMTTESNGKAIKDKAELENEKLEKEKPALRSGFTYASGVKKAEPFVSQSLFADSEAGDKVITVKTEDEEVTFNETPLESKSTDRAKLEPSSVPEPAAAVQGAYIAKTVKQAPENVSRGPAESEKHTPAPKNAPAAPLIDTPTALLAASQTSSQTASPTAPQSTPITALQSAPMTAPMVTAPASPAKAPQNGLRGDDEEDSDYDEEDDELQRHDYRKSMAAATFNFDHFDIEDPDNTLTQLLLYLEHQTVQVILTIQDLLSAIKKPEVSRGELRGNSSAISEVICQMTEATNTLMNQTRNYQLKEHGSWVVRSLEDCNHRMTALCKPAAEKNDDEYADRHFKQRLAGISFDIAKCTKELVKTVEEASLKEDIAQLDARLNLVDLR